MLVRLCLQRRGGIVMIALGLNVAMFIMATLGLYGAIRLLQLLLFVHSALVLSLITVFVLAFLATVLFGSGGAGSEDSAIIYVVFVFFLFDVVAAVFSLLLARRLGAYKQHVAEAVQRGEGLAVPAAGGGTLPRQQYADFLNIMEDRNNAVWASAARRSASGAVQLQPRVQQVRAELQQRGHNTAHVQQLLVVPQAGNVRSTSAPAASRATAEASASEASSGRATSPGVPGGVGISTSCAVCLTQPVDTLLYDCGHLTCAACSVQLKNRFGHCPFCRKRIRDTVPMFVS